MMTPTAKYSQMVTLNGNRALVERICCQLQDRPDLKFAARWHCQRCATWNSSRGSDDTSLGSRVQGAGSAGSRVVSRRHTRTLTGRRQSRSKIRVGWGHHERRTASRCGPRNGKSWRCLQLRASRTPRSKLHQKGLGSRVSQKTWEYRVG